jgi:hypothetical protein
VTYQIAVKPPDSKSWLLYEEQYQEELVALEALARLAGLYGPACVGLYVGVPINFDITARIHPALVNTWARERAEIEAREP